MVAVLVVMPTLLTQTPASASWCAQYTGALGGSENCGFSTFQQCQASVSGVGGFCRPSQYDNPGGSSGRRSSRYRSHY
jgi:hypothetical protein